VRSLSPPWSVQANDQQPQAERSFAKQDRELDPGNKMCCEPRCKHGSEAIEQIPDAINGKEEANQAGEERRSDDEISDRQCIKRIEHVADVVADCTQTERHVHQSLCLF